MTPEQLTGFDVVVTTYQTVAGEFAGNLNSEPVKKKRKVEKGLFDIHWKVGGIANNNIRALF